MMLLILLIGGCVLDETFYKNNGYSGFHLTVFTFDEMKYKNDTGKAIIES
jgi:hypothetical protein